MKHASNRSFIRVGVVVSIVWWGVWWAGVVAASEPQRHQFDRQLMGTTFRLIFYASDQYVANHAAKAAFARIAKLNDVFSDYSPESESRRLADTPAVFAIAGVTVSVDLWRVLTVAELLSRKSEGAFDVSVGPLTKLWRRARRQQAIPKVAAIEKAMRSVSYERIQRLEKTQSIHVRGDAPVRLDFGGIAKGYAADEAQRTLADLGIHRVLIDAGGDLCLGEPPPGKRGWNIAILLNPRSEYCGSQNVREVLPAAETLVLKNCGVATSGDTWQFVEANGNRYSHIIDPRTGYGLTNRTAVTIVAANATLADGLASAVSVMGIDAGATMLESFNSEESSNLLKSARTNHIQAATNDATIQTCGKLVAFATDNTTPSRFRETRGFRDLPRAE